MKQSIYSKILGTVLMVACFSLTSCISEDPFTQEESIEDGTLKLSTTIKGEVKIDTRAEEDLANQDELLKKLVLYIERKESSVGAEKGLIRKYLGMNEVPSSLSLSAGEYVVEGWTGDSVSASWDKKFYRGYQNVNIAAGEVSEVKFYCNIANVIVSVDPVSINAGLSDIQLSFHHSRPGKDNENVMTFGQEEINNDAKAYFMMPTVDHETGEKESVLYYTITGIAGDGSDFIKEGEISGVKSAHEYKVKILADESNTALGGALIRLEIADIPVIESKYEIFPAPTYEAYYGTDEFDLANQIDLTSGEAYSLYLTAIAYNGVRDVSILFSDNLKVNNDSSEESLKDFNNVSLYNDETKRTELTSRYGIQYKRVQKNDKVKYTENETIAVDEVTLTFPTDFLRSIVPADQEQKIIIYVNDGLGSTSFATIRFATSQTALDAPVGSVDLSREIDYTAITTNSATLYGEVLFPDRAQNYGIKYRENGASAWTSVPAAQVRSNSLRYSVHLSGLKPATSYEYKAYCDGFEEQRARTFTTEGKFVIPNASFEDWSTYEAEGLLSTLNVTLPGNTGNKFTSFWGSGNEGAATASLVLTSKSADMQNSGGSSARLASNKAAGMIAAGNIFTGYYVKTDGTNGVLSVGSEYNGSHPIKLRVYANYRPGGSVTVKSGNDKYLPEGFANGNDHGQIYVALTTAPIEIRTNPKSRKLFNRDDDEVVAYGQVTWTDNFGPDGALQLVDIPLEYKDNVKTEKPTHLVIVASASKYGDYFCGSSSSVMYLDDFELIYE